MAYTENNGQYFIRNSANLDTAEALTAAAAVYGELICVKRCKVSRLKFVVTTTVAADTQAPVVEANRRITIGSATGEVLLDQITIPDGTAAGTVMYADFDPVTFEVGDAIAFEHVTQATDGSSAAGAGFYAFEFNEDPEYASNESAYTESA